MMKRDFVTSSSGRSRGGHDFDGRGVCRQCGRSRSAVDHFGWTCTTTEAKDPAKGRPGREAARDWGGHDFESNDVCRRCGRSRGAATHFGWLCLGRGVGVAAEFPRTEQIRTKIADAVNHEERVGAMAAMLHDTVLRAVRKSSAKASPPKGLEQFVLDAAVRGYVQDLEKVPDLLDEVWSAAQAAQIEAQVRPILEFAEAYFLEEADVIPDHLGLVGLRDDAYLVLTLLQRISQRYRELTGHELISVDLSELVVRLGGSLAPDDVRTLDRRVLDATASLDGTVQTLVTYGSTMATNRWSPSRSPGIDFKREMVRSQIRSDLAKDGIFL